MHRIQIQRPKSKFLRKNKQICHYFSKNQFLFVLGASRYRILRYREAMSRLARRAMFREYIYFEAIILYLNLKKERKYLQCVQCMQYT